MQATRSEIDTFKVMSNADFVDWSKAKPRAPLVEVEDSDDEHHDSSPSPRSHASNDSTVRPSLPAPAPAAPLHDDDGGSLRSGRSGSSRSSRSSRRSNAEEAADIPLPPSRLPSVSPPPPPPPAPSAFIPESAPPSSEMPKRVLPTPKKYTAAEENEDYEVRQEKEALLQDILTFERPPHNIKLTRQWNVDQHTLDELQFEYDRIQSELNANQMVEMAKSGIKFGVGGIEMFLKQSGFNAVDGWYKNSCNDMNKYNRPLIKLYKRYWRKTSMSPVMELAFLMFGGLAWTVFENKILRGFGGGGGAASSSAASASAPPAVRPTEYEPPAPPRPGGMRPPSLGSAVRGPRWTADAASATPAPETPAPTPVPAVSAPAPAPAPPATDPALLTALNSIAQQNAMMMQALQTMQQQQRSAVPASPTRSRRSSSSSSSRGSAQLRFSMRKTPKSRGTARSRNAGGAAVMAL